MCPSRSPRRPCLGALRCTCGCRRRRGLGPRILFIAVCPRRYLGAYTDQRTPHRTAHHTRDRHDRHDTYESYDTRLYTHCTCITTYDTSKSNDTRPYTHRTCISTYSSANHTIQGPTHTARVSLSPVRTASHPAGPSTVSPAAATN